MPPVSGKEPINSRLTPADAGRILPLVRGTPVLESPAADAMLIAGESAPVTESFIEDLHIVYVVDFDAGYRYVNQGDLKDLSLSAKELTEKAWINLLTKCQQMETRVHSTEGGRSNMVTIGESLEPSLLMVGGLWRSLASQCRGTLVAACPSRDVLVFCDLAIEGALAEMRDGIARVWASAGRERVSQTLYEWMGDGWLPLERE